MPEGWVIGRIVNKEILGMKLEAKQIVQRFQGKHVHGGVKEQETYNIRNKSNSNN